MTIKRIFCLILAVICLCTMAFPVCAEGGSETENTGIAIDKTNFPDDNFREYVLDNIDENEDELLSSDEITSCTEIDVHDESIASLKGIEYFTKLEKLNCNTNQLTELDVSANTSLTKLECGYNQLTKLDVSKNTALTYLFCYTNSLTALDVSKNTALETLECGTNQLTTLDVSKNTALTTLSCGYNKLTALDVSANTALNWLLCVDNQLTTLDVSKNTSLTLLIAYSNSRQIVISGKTFDLSTLKGFDVNKVGVISGGSINGNILTITGEPDEDGCVTVTYTYNVGKDKTVSFTLEFPKHECTWVDATCTTPRTCSVCGATEGEALGHTEVTDAAVEPTCTTPGKTEGKHCSVCGEVITAQTEIPATGHTVEIVQGKAATETETGLTDGKICSVCGEILVKQRVTPVKGGDVMVDETTLSKDYYTVKGQVITVKYTRPCKVGYLNDNDEYVAITATASDDGSYSFTVPESITNVIIVIKGDVDSDGDVDSSDVTRLKAAYLRKTTLTAEQKFAGDLDNDGDVDSSDVTQLKAAFLRKRELEW